MLASDRRQVPIVGDEFLSYDARDQSIPIRSKASAHSVRNVDRHVLVSLKLGGRCIEHVVTQPSRFRPSGRRRDGGELGCGPALWPCGGKGRQSDNIEYRASPRRKLIAKWTPAKRLGQQQPAVRQVRDVH